MLQHSLFTVVALDQPGIPRRGRLDTPSEALLDLYRHARLTAQANASAVATEISQLRSLVHTSTVLGGPHTLADLLSTPKQLAHILVTPPTPISKSSARARLRAVQQCLYLLGPMQGWDTVTLLAAIDAKLPQRPVRAWHDTGLLVGGQARRRRAPTPSLRPTDLLRLISAAGTDKPIRQARRDTAMVALLCFTGLRMQDLPIVRWEDLLPTILQDGQVGFAIRCTRRGSSVQLPVLGPAEDALRAWERDHNVCDRRSGAVFCALGGASSPLSYRSVRRTVAAACRAAGMPWLAASDLRAGSVYWLHTCGCTEHQIAALLGIAHVRTIDQLLRRHLELDAQRRVLDASLIH